ncbi:MAG TPA: cytochrome c [Myxococcota bacterium]|nr:cytochrome c [Myxococcota bacterium]
MGKLERLTFAGAVLGCWFVAGPAAAETGEEIFTATCSACHTIGGGRLVGPDLAGVSERRDAEWLAKFVKSPQTVIDSGDADAKAMLGEYGMVMPAPPIDDAQIKLVLTYLETAGADPDVQDPDNGTAEPDEPVVPVEPQATPEEIEARVELGQNLFQGTTRLENGGPPCNSCHDVANDAIMGGGVLAKELTSVFSRLGEPGVRAILGSPPFPVMGAAYKDHPLTEDEVVALVTFLEDTEKQRAMPKDYGVGLAASGGVGALGLLVLYTMLWSRRKKASVYSKIYDRQIKSSDL